MSALTRLQAGIESDAALAKHRLIGDPSAWVKIADLRLILAVVEAAIQWRDGPVPSMEMVSIVRDLNDALRAATEDKA